MSDTAYAGLTAEDLPFGFELPVGMPESSAIVSEYDPIPWDLDTMPPGPFLAGFLSIIDVSNVSGYDQILVLRAHQRMASFYQAATYQDMAAVNTTMLTQDGYPQPDVEAADMAAAEVRVALNLTRHAADVEMQFALELHRRLPRLFDMLASGVVDVRRAKVIERGTSHLSESSAQAVVDGIADVATALTTGELRTRLKILCIETDPDEARRRYESAIANRRVVVQPTDVGTANLYALDLPAGEAVAIGNRIHAAALSLHGSDDENRTMDQLRADILVDYLNGIGADSAQPSGSVDVSITMESLLSLTEEPGDVAGFGPVIADVVRRIAEDGDGKLRVIVYDEATGEPTHIVTPTRQPTAQQRRRIQTRDRACVFPGCRMPSRQCDIDHSVAVADGGVTCDCNLAPLCRHDHRIKHQHGWIYHKLPDGQWQWTTRLGHTYTTIPTCAPP
jgi:hypothetical protein